MSPRDAEAELRSVLERASGPGVSVAFARELLRQANDLMRSAPTTANTELRDRIRRALEPALEAQIPRRVKLLEEKLARIEVPSANRVRRALEDTELARKALPEVQMALELRKVLAKTLRALDQFYRQAAGMEAKRLQRHAEEVEELLAALPPDDVLNRSLVSDLVSWIHARRNALLGQGEIETVLAQLRQWEAAQEWRKDLDGVQQELAGNTWAADNATDPRVVEAKDLLMRLRRIAETCRSFESLDLEVRKRIERGELPEAIEEVRQAHHRAEECGLRDREALEKVADLVLDSIEARCERLIDVMERDTEGTIDSREERIEDLNQELQRLKLLPGDLRTGRVAALVARSVAFGDHERERLQSVLLDQERRDFHTLTLDQLARYLEYLKRLPPAGLQQWALTVQRLAEDLEAARWVEQQLDEARLLRLERAAEDFPAGPITQEAARLARAYRKGEIAIASVDLGESEDEELLEQLDALAIVFPYWSRLRRARGLMRDSGHLQEIRQTVKSGTRSDIEKAHHLVSGLSEPSRETIGTALAALENVIYVRDQMEEYAKQFGKRRRSKRAILAGITGAMEVGGGFLSALGRGSFAAASERFPDPWSTAERRIRVFLLEELPEAFGVWLDESLAASETEKQLEAARKSFIKWLEIPPPDFLGIREEGEKRFRRRSTELRIALLSEKDQLAEALSLLEAERETFPPDDFSRLEGDLHRRMALAAHRGGKDPDLAGLLEVCRRFGPDAELLEIFVGNFRATGEVRQLAELARMPVERLAVHPTAAALAGWAHRFRREEIPELAEELAATEELAGLRAFIEGITRTSVGRQAPVFALLWMAQQRKPHWPDDLVGAVSAATESLAERLTESFGGTEKSLSSHQLSDSGRPDEKSEDLDDAELRRRLESAIAETRALLQAGLASVEAWQSSLHSARIWLLPTGRFPQVSSLSVRLEQEEQRLRRDLDIVEEVTRALAGVMASTSGKDGWSRLHPILNRIDPGSSAGLAQLRRLMIFYFRDYVEIVKIIDQFVSAHRAGGEGLNLAQLERDRGRLEKEFRYDFRLGYDRFNLTLRLDGLSSLAFFEELTQLVHEMSEVEQYERLCRAAINKLSPELLKMRLERYQSGTTDGRRAELAALGQLFEQEVDGSTKVRAVFDRAPEVKRSEPARRRLETLRAFEWYQAATTAALLLHSGV